MQLKIHMLTIEDLVPADHLLRKIDAALDFSLVYEETSSLYQRRYGRPPIDPVVMVKYLLIGFLYGIPSERQIEQRCADSNAFRWYLGIDLDERVPDHSTISQLRRRKPGFREVREEAGTYWERLDTYEEEGLAELERRTGKRRKKRVKQIKREKRRSHKRVSRTDPEAGHMKRPGKPEGQYYLSHQTTDTDCGIITGVTVTPGDVYDSVPYLEQLEHIHQNVIPIQAAAADSAYDFPLAHRVLEEHGIAFFVRPQSDHDHTNVELKREAFFYNAGQDACICPAGKQLRLNTLHRSASGLYWLYQADKRDCQSCPLREKCLSENDRRGARKLEHSYFAPQRQRHLARRHDADYREALKKRQIWCEGTFAAQKWGHNLTRVLRRGLGAAEDHCLLSAVALNLKRMIRDTT